MSPIAITLIVLSIAPFAIYFAVKKPLLFPFGLYLLLVPVDALLNTTMTATVTKFVAAASAAALIGHMIVSRRVLVPPKSWTGWAIYMLLCTLTALWTIDSDRTGFMLSQMLGLFALFTIIAIYPAEPRDVRIVGGLCVAAGTIASLWGLAGYFAGTGKEQGNRLTILFNGLRLDPNHIAASLLLPIAIAIGVILATRDMRLRLASVASLSLMVLTLLLTGSRGGLIALGVMMVYVAWTTRYRLQIISFMVVGGLLSVLQPTVWDRFNDKGLEGGSGRLFIWDVAGNALKHYGLFGAGIGAFPTAYDHELLSIFQPTFQGWSRPAHDAFLSAFVEVGILGGIAHLYAWWQSWKDSRGNVVIEASIVGLATASIFLDVLIFKYVWLVFMMAVLVKNAADPKFLRGRHRPRAYMQQRRRALDPTARFRVTRSARGAAHRKTPAASEAPRISGTDGARIA